MPIPPGVPMSSTSEPTSLVLAKPRKEPRRPGGRRLLAVGFLVVAAASAGVWAYAGQSFRRWAGRDVALRTRLVDRGDVRVYVLESGSLESSDNATIKCQ